MTDDQAGSGSPGPDGGAAGPEAPDSGATTAAPPDPDAEDRLAAVVDELIGNTVPERFRALVPDALDPVAKLAWLNGAKTTGLFQGRPDVPVTDSSRPQVSPRDEDLSQLPPAARMARGYGRK